MARLIACNFNVAKCQRGSLSLESLQRRHMTGDWSAPAALTDNDPCWYTIW